MATDQITLQIDADAAQIFKSSSPRDREKLELLLGVVVKAYAGGEVGSIKSTMDEIAAKARERGLTPEILELVLKNQ